MARIANDRAYLARLQDYYARWRTIPAYAALQNVLGVASPSAVAKVLQRLQRAGFLDRSPEGRWFPIEPFFARPLADQPVPAGMPSVLTESGEFHDIDAWLVHHPSRTVLLPVTGDSMTGAGIYAGDLAVVERGKAAQPGDYVIAVIDNELTLKQLALDHGEVVLRPANSAYTVLRPGHQLDIFGVVVGLIRRYRR